MKSKPPKGPKGPSADLLKSMPGQQLLLVPVGMGEEWLLGWGLRDSLLVKPGRFELDASGKPPGQDVLVARLRGQEVLVLSEGSPGVGMPRRLLSKAEPFWNGSEPADTGLLDRFDDGDRDAILDLARERWPAWADTFALALGDVTRPGGPGATALPREERRRLGLVDRVKRWGGR